MVPRYGILAFMVLAPAVGCRDGPTPPPGGTTPIVNVQIASTDTVLSPMETAQYQAEVVDTSGALVLRAVVWAVADTAIAKVSPLGLVTAGAEGSTYLVANVDGVEDSLPLRVTRSYTAVSVGFYGACAIGADSSAYCWGTPAGTYPVAPNGLPNLLDGGYKWTGISKDRSAACGVVVGGDGYCWGLDAFHHLGVADGTGFTSPSLVLNGFQFRAIDVGLEHACGVTTTGQGVCWGKNAHGEVGDSSHVPTLATVVRGGFSWVTIQADGSTSCGLVQSGQAYCWGANATGYLGVDSTRQLDITEPLPVQGSGTYTGLVMGEVSQCALATDGTAHCWGFNNAGQLGSGAIDTLIHKTPQPVVGGHVFSMISGGHDGTCGIAADSTAWCWGTGDGLGAPGPLAQPRHVPGGHSFIAIASDGGRSCGLTAGGGLWCWGAEPLGDGVIHGAPVDTPVRVRDP